MQLPSDWRTKRVHQLIIAETEIAVSSRSRLRAKVLLFKDAAAMRRWWREQFGELLDRYAVAAFTPLASWYDRPGKRPKPAELHPRWFVLMVFSRRHLNMETIAHESVHAGYSYVKRVTRRPWAKIGEIDEEQVAYPAGRIAAAINRWCHRKGLY